MKKKIQPCAKAWSATPCIEINGLPPPLTLSQSIPLSEHVSDDGDKRILVTLAHTSLMGSFLIRYILYNLANLGSASNNT